MSINLIYKSTECHVLQASFNAVNYSLIKRQNSLLSLYQIVTNKIDLFFVCLYDS